jgi:XTP/dITP diphosphohydrolase
MVSIGLALGDDAENSLRSATLEFMDTVRKVEHAVAASRRPDDVPEVLDIAQLGVVTEEEWRAHWPTVEPKPELEVDEPEPDPEVEVDEVETVEAEGDAPVEPEETEEAPEEPEDTTEPEEPEEPVESDEVGDEPAPADQEKSVEPQ